MTKVLRLSIIAVFAFVAFALVIDTYADTRDSRDRRGEESGAVQPPPAPLPTPSPKESSQGSITSSVEADVDTGGNIGGDVTTGDEHAEVYEINIGPTNPPPLPPSEEEENVPAPSDPCDGRRTPCDAEPPSRER